MDRFNAACLFLLAAASTLAAPACDPADAGQVAVASPRTTPPYDPTPVDIAAWPVACECEGLDLPVCGVDGGTYPNPCEAGCADVDVEHAGPCVDPTGTICGGDEDCPLWQFCDTGVICGGEGECRVRPDLCTRQWAPVCGCDGETHASECIAHARGVSVAGEGPCPSCVCPLYYQPVCGVDGVTYGNACTAGCADAAVEHDGACDDPGEQLR